MNWTDLPDEKLTPLLDPLIENQRSPFFQLRKNAMRDLLQACGAELMDTTTEDSRALLRRTDLVERDTSVAAVASHETEGFVLMRQHRPQTKVFIPVTGSVVVFDAKPTFTSSRSRVERAFALQLGEPIGIGTLRKHFTYHVSIYPGEVCGLIGFVTKCFEHFGKNPRSVEFSKRRQALVRAQVLDLAGRWSSSGFASTGSKVISIDMNRLIELMDDEPKWGSAVGRKEVSLSADGKLDIATSEPVLSSHRAVRRCTEESVIRHSHTIYRQSLIARGLYDRVLAGHFYDLAVNAKRNSIRMTNTQIAWYIGLADEDDVPAVIGRNLEEKNIKGFWRQKPTVFRLDRKRLLSYYRTELDSF